MGKMNQNTFQTLFEYGKRVYQGSMDLGTAAVKACSQNPEVAMSSAKHYITWYSKMRVGEFLTWNSNSDLLLYYARRIITEDGVDAGRLAIQSAKQFAKHVSRHELEQDLDALATEHGISLAINDSELQPTTRIAAFQKWLRELENHNYTESTIYRYSRALEMAAEWLSIQLPQSIFAIGSIADFNACQQMIKSVPNFSEVNQAHGHGDLSAALSLYSRFLTAQSDITTWWPSEEEYTPGISKEQWLELLNNPEIFTPERLAMMAQFYAIGGQASCIQMAETYGKTSDYYRMACGVHLAERIAKETGCPLCNQENAKFWPVLFVGRDAKSGERGNYIWKLRDELYAALSEFAIEKYLVRESKMGTFDSWEIVDENTAIKHCDKSFFEHNGSGVPKGISWFFNADSMALGETRNLKLMFKGAEYAGRVSNESTDHRRVRIFWNAELGKQFAFAKENTTAHAVFKKITDDVYEIILSGGEEELSVKETIEKVKAYIATKGFTYEDGLIENFYLSLKSKPFVILAGTSGTGKTRLVKLFAEAVGATNANSRYQMVSVRPDWSDSTDLFGHVDLNGRFVPGAIIDFVKRAELDPAKPYFLCLDEMNLARVEYYLSDVLSVIETRDMVAGGKIDSAPLVPSTYYGSDADAAGKYGTVKLPENLYIVGTVNMDETTFPFSRKVLDRANTIEFSYVDLLPKFDEMPRSTVQTLNLDNSFLKTEYLLLGQCADKAEAVGEYCTELQQLNRTLQTANAHVGYRVRDEIVFYLLNNKKHELISDNEAMDNELMQKILPRIQGSSASVKKMLCELFKHCVGDYDGLGEDGDDVSAKMMKAIDGPHCKYRHSAEKIAFMVRRFEEDGFTSYWL